VPSFKLSTHVIPDLLLGTFHYVKPFKSHKIIKSSNSNIITKPKEMPVKEIGLSSSCFETELQTGARNSNDLHKTICSAFTLLGIYNALLQMH